MWRSFSRIFMNRFQLLAVKSLPNPTSRPWTTMRPLFHLKFRTGRSRRSRHIAKPTNSIDRLICIDTVEELMKVHVFPGILGPHAWVPNRRGYTA
jgi:hypothetical protein